MPGAKRVPAAKQNVSAREMWLQAVKGRAVHSGDNRRTGLSTTKKSPSEYWVGTLRRSQGLQSEIAAMDTFGKGGPSGESVPYLSTSHYLRERVGTEKSSKRSSNGVDMRAAPGTPAYKTPEEYYDEVLELRKQIGVLDKDSSLLRAKLRRVEEDNLKKEKEIESLMDPTKSGDLRRTLTDRKPDSSAVVHSLKQKIMRLEQQVREKEQSISTMKSDVRATNLEELRLKMEMFYQEIIRLRSMKTATTPRQPPKSASKETKETPSKIKALNDTILRMNEKNVRLTAENKSLKEDLEQLMAQVADTKERKLEYEDMSKRELASKLAKLEGKLESQKSKGDSASLISQDTGSTRLRADTLGKLELDGSLAERLELLDKRETELLEEIKRLKSTMKKIKEDRQHFRQKSDEKSKEIKGLKKEIADLLAELEHLHEKDVKRKTNSPHSSRQMSLRDRPPSPRERPASPRDHLTSARDRPVSSRARENERRDRRLRDIRENHAAKTIQRGWRQHKHEEEELAEHNAKVEQFRTNRAARQIQHQWNKHRHEQEELNDAAMVIQSAARGNDARRRQLRRYEEEEEEEELSDAVELLQSTVRGHWSRQKYVNTRSRPSSADRDSEGYDSDEAAMQIQSSLRGHSARKHYLNNSTSSRPPSVRSTPRSSVNTQRAASSPRRRRSSLDSAGEEENISDELITPRSRRNSGSLKRSTPVKYDRRHSSRSLQRAAVELDDEDDDDIMM
ncbi:IQ domain-containing protein E-like isoform X2 [Watersipora subatra]|uniref:IQ domain-containing protein E-like isoform X2 n=1 Tax=Watersipora subatra TaxID=2589382 RepID=UPI00355C33FE